MSANSEQQNAINWQPLHEKAQQAHDNAYAPYSHFKVGAALLGENDEIFTGCNVENASYGLTVCAERNCIATAIGQGVRHVKALVVYTAQTELTSPCGACRQVIAEFMTQDAMVGLVNHLGDSQLWRVSDLLPDAFTPQALHKAHKSINSSVQEKGQS